MTERRSPRATPARRRSPPSRSPRSPDAPAALEAARLLGIAQMASASAHDMNNVLAAVIMRAELLGLDLPADAPGRESLPVIEDAATRGIALVQRARELGRLARPYAPQPLALADAVDDARIALRERLRHNARCEIAPASAALPRVLGDRAELALAIQHLIANALDATEPTGSVRVRVSADDRWVACEVADRGHGLGDEARARAFEPFFSTRGELGRGIGLTVALAVAARHGGRVELAAAPGGGTIATLSVPRPR
jgi:signal transduction histidine kinase